MYKEIICRYKSGHLWNILNLCLFAMFTLCVNHILHNLENMHACTMYGILALIFVVLSVVCQNRYEKYIRDNAKIELLEDIDNAAVLAEEIDCEGFEYRIKLK